MKTLLDKLSLDIEVQRRQLTFEFQDRESFDKFIEKYKDNFADNVPEWDPSYIPNIITFFYEDSAKIIC